LLVFFFAFFLVAMDLFSLFHFHGSCNGDLLQLIECIESTRNEVKRKMIESSAHIAEPKSPEGIGGEKFERVNRELSLFTLSPRDDLHSREMIFAGAREAEV